MVSPRATIHCGLVLIRFHVALGWILFVWVRFALALVWFGLASGWLWFGLEVLWVGFGLVGFALTEFGFDLDSLCVGSGLFWFTLGWV